MSYSALATGISAFVQILTDHFATTDPQVQVLDGPTVDDIGQNIVAVGITGEDFHVESNLLNAGLMTNQETFELWSMVRSWTGDEDMALRRARAFGIFDVISDLVKEYPDLNGTVARAQIDRVDYLPSRLPEGAVASVNFRLRIDAFTS